jgi:hypothetical protein
MLDPRGFVARCNSTDLFIGCGNDEIRTSTGRHGCNGTTQATVIAAWRAAGKVAHERDFAPVRCRPRRARCTCRPVCSLEGGCFDFQGGRTTAAPAATAGCVPGEVVEPPLPSMGASFEPARRMKARPRATL